MAIGTNVAPRPIRAPQPPAPAADIILKPPRFGVAIFNNPASPTSGVACVEGQRPKSFEARTELPSDVIWISDAYSAARAQNMRGSDYLRTTPRQIGDDLGVDVRDPVDGLPVVAECIARVRDMAAHAYPWVNMAVDWSEATLGRAIAKVTRMSGDPLAEAVQGALKQAYQTYSTVPDVLRPDFANAGGGRMVTLRTNRLRYAHYLCGQLYPTGVWRSLHRKVIFESPVEAFLDPDRPVLVEATVEFLDRSANAVPSALVAYGSNGSSRPIIRNWISQPELAWLLGHANVHIQSALVCERSEPLPERLQLPRILTADPLYALSVAAGVLAENHWTGVASEQYVRKAMPGATAQPVAEVSSNAVWMRAYDRAYCFQMALEAHRRGYTVVSYGYGSVTVWARKEAYVDLMELAAQLGACHPDLGAMQDRDAVSMEST